MVKEEDAQTQKKKKTCEEVNGRKIRFI